MKRLTIDEMKKAGLRVVKSPARSGMSDCDGFVDDMLLHGFPAPVTEFKFARDRDFKFDYYFLKTNIAIEKIGGVWGVGKTCRVCHRRRPGHHSYGKDQIDDMIRRNLAQSLGYVVLEYPSAWFDKPDMKLLEDLLRAFIMLGFKHYLDSSRVINWANAQLIKEVYT